MTDHPRQQLQHIILHYGRSICDEPKRCEALLRDLCPDNRRETTMLISALREGVVQEFLGFADSPLPPEVLILRQAQVLHDSMGMAETLARWTVESWAMALGIPIAPVQEPKKPDLAPPQQSATPPAALQTPAQLLQLAKQRQAQIKQDQHQAQRHLELDAAWQGNSKIGRHGEYLPVTATTWAAVLDARTQLMWAVNPTMKDGFPNPIAGMKWEDAMAWPEALNDAGWCGYKDWRLPTVDELKTLLISEKQNGLLIRRDFFPDIPTERYDVWTSSPYAGNGYGAWIVAFYNGHTGSGYVEDSLFVRVMRSSPVLNNSEHALPQQTIPVPSLQTPEQLLQLAKQRHAQVKQDQRRAQRELTLEAAWRGNAKIGRHGEHLPLTAASWGAVLDANTKLMWAVNPTVKDGFPNPIEIMTWEDAMAWPEVLNYVGWCGYQDWRLPTVDELKTLLISEKQSGLHIERTFFPDISMTRYFVWTSSPYADVAGSAWLVDFGDGYADYDNEHFSGSVRVVRSSS